MKKVLLAVGISAMGILSCKEKAPLIQLTAAPPKVDSTYILSSVPAAEPHNILIENFTGATCSNCPAAHDILLALDSQYVGRINIVSMHVLDFPQTRPPEHAKYDFRTQLATDVEASVYQSLLAMPVAGIDRLPVGQTADQRPYQIYRNVWNSVVSDRLNIVDSINMALTSSFDAGTNKATINVKVTFLQPVKAAQNLSIAVVEDGFIDVQEFPTGFDDAYHFDDIFRGMVTSGALGDTVLPSIAVKEPGRVYDVTYTYDVNKNWNPANCRFVAFVHGSSSVAGAIVYQSKQAKMKQ